MSRKKIIIIYKEKKQKINKIEIMAKQVVELIVCLYLQ